jgi:hypothetical protein
MPKKIGKVKRPKSARHASQTKGPNGSYVRNHTRGNHTRGNHTRGNHTRGNNIPMQSYIEREMARVRNTLPQSGARIPPTENNIAALRLRPMTPLLLTSNNEFDNAYVNNVPRARYIPPENLSTTFMLNKTGVYSRIPERKQTKKQIARAAAEQERINRFNASNQGKLQTLQNEQGYLNGLRSERHRTLEHRNDMRSLARLARIKQGGPLQLHFSVEEI